MSILDEDVLKMKTGLATRDVFNIVVSYTERIKDQITYFSRRRVELMTFEDQIYLLYYWKSDKITQIFIFLSYLAVVYPQLKILLPHSSMLSIQFTDLMTSVPSRDKNKLSVPSSFNQFGSCRVIIDCMDIGIATPGLMSQQNVTYSSYSGMHPF